MSVHPMYLVLVEVKREQGPLFTDRVGPKWEVAGDEKIKFGIETFHTH